MQIYYLVPTRPHVGLTSVSLGLVRALQRQGFRVGFAKPVVLDDNANEHSIHFARELCGIEAPQPLRMSIAAERDAAGEEDQLLDDVVGMCLDAGRDADALVVEGMHTEPTYPFAPRLNAAIVRGLKADAVLVASAEDGDPCDEIVQIATRYETVGCRVAGAFINKAPAAFDEDDARTRLGDVPLWGVLRDDPALLAPRTLDVARHLGAAHRRRGRDRDAARARDGDGRALGSRARPPPGGRRADRRAPATATT